MSTLKDFMHHNPSRTEMREHYKTVASRVDQVAPTNPFMKMQPFDFGIAANDYEWKNVGTQRLLYNLCEKDRYERLKVN